MIVKKQLYSNDVCSRGGDRWISESTNKIVIIIVEYKSGLHIEQEGTLKQNPERSEGALSMDNSKFKDLEAGAHLELSRKSKELGVKEVERVSKRGVSLGGALRKLKHPWLSIIGHFMAFPEEKKRITLPLHGAFIFLHRVGSHMQKNWKISLLSLDLFFSCSGFLTFENYHVTILFLPNDLVKTNTFEKLYWHSSE